MLDHTYLKIVLVLANVSTCPRTIPIPRSSDAFSYKIKVFQFAFRCRTDSQKSKRTKEVIEHPEKLVYDNETMRSNIYCSFKFVIYTEFHLYSVHF